MSVKPYTSVHFPHHPSQTSSYEKFLRLRGVMGSEFSDNRKVVKGSEVKIKGSDMIIIFFEDRDVVKGSEAKIKRSYRIRILEYRDLVKGLKV